MSMRPSGSVRVPSHVRETAKRTLWADADRLQWDALTPMEKAKYYQQWTDSDVGRSLAAHMDARAVRVFIKDTLLKDYSRHALKKHQEAVLRVCGRPADQIAAEFIKPHGLRFQDGSQVVWGRADDWKSLLGAAFERTYGQEGGQASVIFFRAAPRYTRKSSREMVDQAALRLGIGVTHWFD